MAAETWGRFVRTLNSWGLRIAHELLLARLRVEAAFARLVAPSQPRVAATACWTFPIYSQTFVHQEVLALARGGFSVRFLYSALGPQDELAHACRSLWRLKRRVLLDGVTGARDFAHFKRRMPKTVDAVLREVAAASGLPPEEVERHAHFLHAFSFARAADAWGADYLHSYFFYERTLFALVASRLLDIPRGVSCYADHLLRDYPLKLVPLHLRTCDVIVATSQRIRSELEALHGATLERVVVKPNAIDTSDFPAKQRQPRLAGAPFRLVSVNRIDPKKGLEFLIEAVGIVRDRGLAVDLQIVGAPDSHLPECLAYDRALRAEVSARGLDDVVHFAGRRNSREVRTFLDQADVFVASSVELPNGDKDGIPTAVLEAMAAGSVIVASDAGSIGEIIDNERDGLIVPQRDSRALAAAIERLAQDPPLARRLSANATARARRDFDVATSEGAFHGRVRDAIGARRAASGRAGALP